MKPFAILGILLAVFLCLVPASHRAFAAKTCGDFESQAAAQAYMSDTPNDPDNLDPDHNGIACENIPCPCDTVPVDWFTGGATTPSQSGQASAAATPKPGSTSSSSSAAGPQVKVVSQEVYNAVVAAIKENRDPALVYNELTRQPPTPTLTVPSLRPGNSITPPNTGDAGLAAGR